jgi:tRNA threonylcarbamoyladenosine biosynthesis protein TsaE
MRLVLRGEQAQVEFGQRLSAALGPRALVFLNGDLGTGKTTLVRGFMRARGHRGAVKSPTYTLIEPYELPGGVCYHLDLYRLGDPEELEFLGLREMLQEQAVLLVEWPQRGQGWLPEPDLVVHLDYLGEGTARELALQAGSPMGENVISMISG